MSEITLQDVLSLNEELAALAEIRSPIDLVSGLKPIALEEELKGINRSLTLRSELGQPLLDSIVENKELPVVYRNALQAGFRSNRLVATLDGISRQPNASDALRRLIGRSLIPPLIISMLAYVGFILLCFCYSPTVESMYLQLRQAPSGYTHALILLRTWLPYWATLCPLLLLGGVLLWKCGWRGWQQLVPGVRPYQEAIRNANFSNQLNWLLENGVSLAESLPLAAAVTGDEKLIALADTLAINHAQAEVPAGKSKELSVLPPLLRWALSSDLGDQPLPEILQFAEKTYHQAAERRLTAWRIVLPSTIGALLGGLVVLAYGLSLFAPFVQLLQDIAR